MIIEPKGAPSIAQPPGSTATAPNSPQAAARDRAIQMLTGNNQVQETPVANPNQVSPEEMTAIQPKDQTDSNEVPSNPSEDSKATKASEEDELLSKQYAILARKEKALRQREAALKQREAAFKAPEAKPAETAIDPSQYIPKDRLVKDPFAVLGELGLTYDQLTEMVLNAPKQDTIALQRLEEEIKALKQSQEQVKKSYEEQQTQAYQQAVNQIQAEARQLVKLDPSFETIRETNSVGDVVELIEETWKRDGILLSVEEAAREVEDYLVEEATKLARIKKIQQRLAPAAKPAAVEEQPAAQPAQKPQMKTLTNAVSSSRKLTARERAILAAEGKLNR